MKDICLAKQFQWILVGCLLAQMLNVVRKDIFLAISEEHKEYFHSTTTAWAVFKSAYVFVFYTYSIRNDGRFKLFFRYFSLESKFRSWKPLSRWCLWLLISLSIRSWVYFALVYPFTSSLIDAPIQHKNENQRYVERCHWQT